MKYLIDSWAWVEYFNGTSAGVQVKNFLEEDEIYTTILNIAEVISLAKRRNQNHEAIYTAMAQRSKMIDILPETSKNAGLIHAEMRGKKSGFGMIDAFMLAVAKKMNAKIITGDEHFKGIKEAILITK